jgi:hypothetical protein
METIPVQLDQLLTLALGVVFVTQVLKAAAKALDAHVGGKGAVVVSAVVSVALTALVYAAGWAVVSVPACDPLAPFACVQGWLVTAGGALALANLLYVAVYGRVFTPREAETKAVP